MRLNRESALQLAKNDLAKRLKIGPGEVHEHDIEEKEFPDMALGAPENGEMAAQMISSGWLIRLGANGRIYEYRADKYHVRLHNFEGANYVVR